MLDKGIKTKTYIMGAILFLFLAWEIFVPQSLRSVPESVVTITKGMGYKDISLELKEQGIFKNTLAFNVYVVVSGNYGRLQSGSYNLSPSMSLFAIVEKFSSGDVVKEKVTIPEGWDINQIAQYFEQRNIALAKEFLDVANKDWSGEFDFLKDKPKNLSLEGYIFPDTYYLSMNTTTEEFLKIALDNFSNKVGSDLLVEIKAQRRSLFEIVTMASMIEKEVILPADKKIVSGILWKRIQGGMPLQVDATVNYATGKKDSRVSLGDTKVDSPYNTYKYYGLPKGPISNPSIESIWAAIYPTKTDYWYYLSARDTGKTIFSKTLDEHNIAIAKYLRKD